MYVWIADSGSAFFAAPHLGLDGVELDRVDDGLDGGSPPDRLAAGGEYALFHLQNACAGPTTHYLKCSDFPPGGEVGIQAYAECRLSIVRICQKNKKSPDFSRDFGWWSIADSNR